MAKLNLNFQFVSNRKTPSAGATIKQVRAATDGFARIVVQDVAIAAADRYRLWVQRSFIKSLEKTAKAATNQMAVAIGTSMANPYKYAGPYGDITLSTLDGISLSDTGRASGFRDTLKFNTHQSGIKWERWSKHYAKHKARWGGKDRWWYGSAYKRKSEHLIDYLKQRSGDFYEKALGPVRVLFFKKSSKPLLTTTGTTAVGRGGRLAATVQIGRVEVLAFNKITPAMMPGLATMNPVGNNPLPGLGVARLLNQRYPRNRQLVKLAGMSSEESRWVSVDRKVPTDRIHRNLWGKNKLFRLKKFREERYRKGSFRPAVDPFVSYFLMRAIPNAVFRRLEREAEFTAGT